jgi:hypothetical protein
MFTTTLWCKQATRRKIRTGGSINIGESEELLKNNCVESVMRNTKRLEISKAARINDVDLAIPRRIQR